jgi:transcriptional regulator with XRE-family HTH domain
VTKPSASNRGRPKLRRARIARGWGQTDFAKHLSYLGAKLEAAADDLGVDQSRISEWELGKAQPGAIYTMLICRLLEMPPEELDLPPLPPFLLPVAPTPETPAAPLPYADANELVVRVSSVDDESLNLTVKRRQFLEALGGAVVTVVGRIQPDASAPSHPEPSTAHPIDPSAILGYRTLDNADHVPGVTDLGALRDRVSAARRAFQGCRYADVSAALPQILADLHVATDTGTGDNLLTALSLSAEAHHVTASLLLKHDDHGLAWIAADRSMRAAERSGNQSLIAASARIVTHAMMNAGHHAAATDTAAKLAWRFAADWSNPTADDLSAYGSLVLRGATAAARHGNRGMAHNLLDEAEQAARRLGADYQHPVTAFGCTNVQMHRVHIAVSMGDAGMAIDLARTIDLGSVTIVERRASTLIDLALALSQAGRIEQSYQALRSAEALAPEEMYSRPAVRHLVLELLIHAPSSLAQQLKALARRVHVPGLLE